MARRARAGGAAPRWLSSFLNIFDAPVGRVGTHCRLRNCVQVIQSMNLAQSNWTSLAPNS